MQQSTNAPTRLPQSTYTDIRQWLADNITRPEVAAEFAALNARCCNLDDLTRSVLLCEPGAYETAHQLVTDVYAFVPRELDMNDAEALFGIDPVSTAVLAVEDIDNGARHWSPEIQEWVEPLLLRGRFRQDGERLAELDTAAERRTLTVFEQHYRRLLKTRREHDRDDLSIRYGIEVAK